MRANTAADFWANVTIRGMSQCWPWKGSTRGRGRFQYGIFSYRGKRYSTGRFAWMARNGKLPKLAGADFRGTCILFECHNGICCNPEHLSPGTHRRSMEVKVAQQRDTSKHKKHCKHGHPRTPANLWTSKKGLRHCRACHRTAEQERRKRNKEQRLFSSSQEELESPS